MMRVFVVACILSLVFHSAGADQGPLWNEDTPLVNIRGRSLQSSNESYCAWNGNECVLRRNFIGRLPDLLGTATTNSARLLAEAALRATACADISAKPACLDALNYNCNWNTFFQSCELADLLDVDSLRGVGYCPGSRMEAAVNCTLLTPKGGDACNSSAYDCVTSSVARVLDTTLVSGLGDRLYDMVSSSMLGMVVTSASGADQLAAAVLSLLSGIVSNLPVPQVNADGQVCVARWMTDSSEVRGIASAVWDDVKTTGSDLLSALLGPELLGSCEGAQRLRSAVSSCSRVTSQPNCEALRDCVWKPTAGVCRAASDLLPSRVLDDSDRWVWVLANATASCESFTDLAACNSATNLDVVLQGGVRSSAGGGTGSPAGNSGGGGDSSAAGRAVVLTWGSMLAMALAAVAGVEAVRRG